MLHSAGWLESSMAISFAQFVIDLDQLAVLQRFAEGIEITEETLALDAIAETEPAGHFFAHPHTLRHYNSIFLEPMIESASNYEAWVAGGAKDITSQARNWARRALGAYERPFLDEAVDEALADYVARRKRELPDIEV